VGGPGGRRLLFPHDDALQHSPPRSKLLRAAPDRCPIVERYRPPQRIDANDLPACLKLEQDERASSDVVVVVVVVVDCGTSSDHGERARLRARCSQHPGLVVRSGVHSFVVFFA
ncbi:unnamed protein product, partial [Ectocarpus sp. 12 AP-2014]